MATRTFVFMCWAFVLALASTARADSEAVARALEQRLLAPCCYQQTLDIHRSELSDTLRREIRERLARGEQAAAIQDALIVQYGERILAVPPANPLEAVATFAMLAVFAAGLLLWLRVRRWRGAEADPPTELIDPDAVYDRAVDEALAALERP